MKWILMIAWASSGTGYTSQDFDTLDACRVARLWAVENDYRGRNSVHTTCINKSTGEKYN